MLAPKRVKYRKWQKGRLRGPATRGATIAFGDIGLKAVEHGKLSSQQIDAPYPPRRQSLDPRVPRQSRHRQASGNPAGFR